VNDQGVPDGDVCLDANGVRAEKGKGDKRRQIS
jgi:hypothetical protein